MWPAHCSHKLLPAALRTSAPFLSDWFVYLDSAMEEWTILSNGLHHGVSFRLHYEPTPYPVQTHSSFSLFLSIPPPPTPPSLSLSSPPSTLSILWEFSQVHPGISPNFYGTYISMVTHDSLHSSPNVHKRNHKPLRSIIVCSRFWRHEQTGIHVVTKQRVSNLIS